MSKLQNDKIRNNVRQNYKEIALRVVSNDNCCAPSCCTPEENQKISIEEIS